MYSKKEQTEAIEYLRTILKPGDTVYTILRHVSRSGMSRTIGCVIKDMNDITAWVAKATNSNLDRDRWGVKVRGCGMDMGFELVYNLSYTLFPGGFDCIGEDCPANDHINDYLTPDQDRSQDYAPTRHHSDGGYALRRRWM